MPDSSEVDAAIIAKLAGDTGAGGLMTYMSDGVFVDVAPAGKTKFVIVSLVIEQDEPMFRARAYEDATYLVKAVDKSTSGTAIKAAAARIDTLLDGVALTITGYTHMLTQRVERVRYTEVDDIDPDSRWQHRGARFQVMVCS